MQSDQFDKKVKQAADHHHPAYDEQAWDRMEKLLDKHLPQKEDKRRRFIFFLLLPLLIGVSAIWLLVSKPWKEDKKMANTDAVIKNNSTTNNTDKISNPVSTGNTVVNNNENVTTPVLVNDQPINNNTATEIVNNDPVSTKRSSTSLSRQDKEDQTSFVTTEGNRRSRRTATPVKNDNNDPQKNEQPVAVVASPSSQQEAVPVPEKNISANVPAENKTVAVDADKVKEDKPVQKEDAVIAKTNEPENKPTETKKKDDKNKKKNSLFFSLSAGPDLSFVGSGNSSKTKLVAGAGIGFTYKEKFTLRTGFYSGRKVYSAKPSDYKAPPEFYTFYPYLEKVNANCKVYEIPLSLSYNFGKKNNFFVSAGVSSFLMNEESYDYVYKYTPTGNTYTNNWTIKNENSHFFSVGTISAGYKHNIGKRISVMAEPYLKVPFGGVGYGKVKLNSGGVLFTVGVKAF